MTAGSFHHAHTSPVDCAAWLSESGVVAGAVTTVAHRDRALTIYAVHYDPPPPEHLPGYPAEDVRVTIVRDGRIYAVPVGGNSRRWLHRYPHYTLTELVRGATPVSWEQLLGPLCLWYPGDPPSLRWSWADGLDAYLRLVQLHLWDEEYWRRHNSWPVEDAPHGHRPDGRPHPILTPELRRAS